MYVMGTRLQTKTKQGSSAKSQHKLPSCKYHDIDLCNQGAKVKTMSQESLQMVRKHRTIQADKLRSFECSFLANYICDFRHNLQKWEIQKKELEKNFGKVARDEFW